MSANVLVEDGSLRCQHSCCQRSVTLLSDIDVPAHATIYIVTGADIYNVYVGNNSLQIVLRIDAEVEGFWGDLVASMGAVHVSIFIDPGRVN